MSISVHLTRHCSTRGVSLAVTVDQLEETVAYVCYGLHCVLGVSAFKTWIIKVECHKSKLNVFYHIYSHTQLELFT